MGERKDELLRDGRAAFERHAWTEAFGRFRDADADGGLEADDLVMLADSAWWMAEPKESLAARERAYAAFAKNGNNRRAAAVALRLAQENGEARAYDVAGAWFERAQKLLEGDEDCVEYGYVLFAQAAISHSSMPLEATLELADRAAELGKKYNDKDLQALATMAQGLTQVAYGDVTKGLARLDQATVAAVAGDLTLWSAGWVYCGTIGACREVADYQRASEWTEATTRWCERQAIGGFPGVCRVYRAETVAQRGAWAQAEQEARKACEELQRYQISEIAALGFYAIGEIRRRMGDLPAAEEAFLKAHELGAVPEPGLSLIRLAQGRTADAAASLKRALANAHEHGGRARLLPVEVEAALALGDRDRASAASRELDELAKQFGTTAMEAVARVAHASVELAEGDATAAEATVREGLRRWQQLEMPYEVARTRLLLAKILVAQGDPAAADLETQAAHSAFERLGARLDARLTDARASDPSTAGPDEDLVTRTFLFTDIVRSTKLVDAIGDRAWTDLIRWHDQTLRALIAEHRGEEIRHQGDGLFVSFAKPAEAIDSAIAIQRRLDEHRRANGFAPEVRIGMHTATAQRRGLDYAGFGIHEAARIGGVAGAGEILVSRATLDSAGRTYRTEKRDVELKDISGPVEVASVDWR